MSWTCPQCGRKFKTERHYHSCDVVTMDDHLKKCTPEIKKLAEKIFKMALSWKNVQITPLKSMILITAGMNFMSMKPKKEWLEIEFILEEEINEFPIYKTLRYTRNKVVHSVKIDSEEDLNLQLTDWLKQAYNLTQKK
jgi:hypothetical protein